MNLIAKCNFLYKMVHLEFVLNVFIVILKLPHRSYFTSQSEVHLASDFSHFDRTLCSAFQVLLKEILNIFSRLIGVQVDIVKRAIARTGYVFFDLLAILIDMLPLYHFNKVFVIY
jgi:hypothetical protein